MGTEVQSKMNLPGYRSMREPENNIGNNGWPLNNNCRASKSNSTAGTIKEEFLQHAKEKVRQTMLMHESIFRHQLNELHRIYRVQRDMMNKLKAKATIDSSCVPYDDEKRKFNLPNDSFENSSYGRSSPSIIDSIQTPSSINGISMQSNVGPSQTGVNLNDYPPLESKCKKLQRRLFDLELPADEYIDSQDKQPEVSGASMVESYPCVTNIVLRQNRYPGMDAGIPENSGCNRDASSSHISTRMTFGEPVNEAPGSASVGSLGILKSGEIGRQNLSVNLSSEFQAKGHCQKLSKERKGADLSFVHLENEKVQRGWSSYNYEAGNNRSDRISFAKSSYPDSCISFKSQCESRITSEAGVPNQFDAKKTGQHRKRTTFGVEISERNHDESAAALQRLGLHSRPKTAVPNSQPFTILPSEVSFKHYTLSSFEGCCSRASPQLNKNDPASIQNIHAAVRSALPSRDKMHSADGFGKGLQLNFQESRVSNQPIVGVQPNGIWNCNVAYEPVQVNAIRHPGGLDFTMEKKSSNYVNIDMPHFQRPQNEAISQKDFISNDGQGKQEHLKGGMWWFKARPQTSSEYPNIMEGPYSTNSDELKNGNRIVKKGGISCLTEDSSIIKGTKNFQQNIHIGDSSTPTKIPGFPVLSKPHLTTYLPSPSSYSQSRSFGSVINDGSIVDPVNVSSQSEAHIEDSLSVGGRSVNGRANLRHQFDLNLSASEEEAGAADSSQKSSTKISAEKVEIDLEVSLPFKKENIETNSECRIKENSVKQPKWLQHELGESPKDSTMMAAEAIVFISSYNPDRADNFFVCQHPEASLDNPLHWFTDIIFSYEDDSKNTIGAVSVDNDVEDPIPGGLDYFEYMTLKLTEIQVEECIFKPEAPETPEKEMPWARLPRRGQAKRRRQRKDFQRDVLPGLTSLSKYEVTEDMQTFRSLIRATGGSWESGIAQRNASKGSSVRGRKRSRSSVPSPSKVAGCQSHIQQSSSRETSLCEGSLAGWGKKTKRLPRRRCQLGKPFIK